MNKTLIERLELVAKRMQQNYILDHVLLREAAERLKSYETFLQCIADGKRSPQDREKAINLLER
jgi:hypothetical protein